MIKQVTVIASLALIATAVMAAPSFASGLKWNAEGTATVKGTLTLKKNGSSPVSCALSGSALTWNEAGQALIGGYSGLNPWISNECTKGLYFSWDIGGEEGSPVTLGKSGGYLVEFTGCCGGTGGGSAPWTGRHWIGAAGVPFTNGSGTTASHMDFSETVIGTTDFGETLTATGKLNVTRTGGLLTVGPA